MIAILCVHTRDEELALQNAKWMNELGGCKAHTLYMLHDSRVSNLSELIPELRLCFETVIVNKAGALIDGWPEGANYMFRTAMGWLAPRNFKYFLWLEPDAIPISEGWMDKLEAEYVYNAKPFMGDRVAVNNVPLHMSGIGIYENPIYNKAGEAYRAFEDAWDVAAANQIVPNAHFTKLIEHAWKHPKFTSIDELATQIRSQAVLFHSSKDGSLIHLLRARRSGNPVPISIKEPEFIASGSPALPSPPMFEPTYKTCDIFIRTYPGDYLWLKYCLSALKKYATGFRKVWVASSVMNTIESTLTLGWWPSNWEWKIVNEETQDGYLSQQIHKLYADVITNYGADYILHIDSDTILTRTITPASFMNGDKIVWYYTPYTDLSTPWQPFTEKFMQQPVANEFMRRQPIMVPRWLYSDLRRFCHERHGVIISDYIKNQPPRAFSEFNALGAYAFQFEFEKFEFVDTTGKELPPPFARQFYSWGGITPEVKVEIDKIFGEEAGNGNDPTPASTGVIPSSPPLLDGEKPEGVKELPSGLWVFEGDQISEWVEQENRLDHDQNLLPKILSLINEEGCVVDAGAFIGDHTTAYLKKVGPEGMVFAFEPNPKAVMCLNHNLSGRPEDEGSLQVFQCALGDERIEAPLSGNNGQAGGSYIGDHMKVADVKVERLDDFHLNPDFIKWDVEGSEVKALKGALKTIQKCKPIMVIEVNAIALERQCATPQDIYEFLDRIDYTWEILQENLTRSDPLYDIVAAPKLKTAKEVDEREGMSLQAMVTYLREYAEKNPENRRYVLKMIRKAKLVPYK